MQHQSHAERVGDEVVHPDRLPEGIDMARREVMADDEPVVVEDAEDAAGGVGQYRHEEVGDQGAAAR